MRDADRELARLRAQVAEAKEQLTAPSAMAEVVVPDIIEFVLSDRYLGLPVIFPRQAAYLKLMFLQDDLLSGYDEMVLDDWAAGFKLPDTDSRQLVLGGLHYEGTRGIPPDWRQRLAINKAAGLPWFREHVMVWGRRGGKNRMGAIAAAYVTWTYLSFGDPQAKFGIAAEKVLSGLMFGSNYTQARSQSWLDMVEVIIGAGCFTPFVQDIRADRLIIATPADLGRPNRHLAGSIEISAKETTVLAGRGPAAYMAFFDEMAHVSATTAKASADAVYQATMPGLDQCGRYGFVYESSSPAQQIGSFYRNHRRGLQVDPRTKVAAHPEVLTSQLASWDPYLDWDRADTLPRVNPVTATAAHLTSNGQVLTFPRPVQPNQVDMDRMRRLEEDDPASFAVERRAQWATVLDAFLNPVQVEDMFIPDLRARSEGALNIRYQIHVDPSTRHDNYAWVIAHREPGDEHDMPIMKVDAIRAFDPKQFPGQEIDHMEMGRQLLEDVRAFRPEEVTFDQHQSAQMIQWLTREIRDLHRYTTSVYEVTATSASNREAADVLRNALALRQIQCPPHQLLRDELLFLQQRANGRVDHPTSGPIQSNDIATCLMELARRLLGNDGGATIQALSDLPLSAAPFTYGPPPSDPEAAAAFSAAGRRSNQVPVGQRSYPGGPKRLPDWAR